MIALFYAALKNATGALMIVLLSMFLFTSAKSHQVNYYKSIMDYPIHLLVQIDVQA